MKTSFTFNQLRAEVMYQDLAAGRCVQLTKSNGTRMRVSQDCGIYLVSILAPASATLCENVPYEVEHLFDFLEGLQFTKYEIINA